MLVLRRLIVGAGAITTLLMAGGASAQAESSTGTSMPECSAWNASIPAVRYRVCIVTRGAATGTWARSVVSVLNATDVPRMVSTAASMVVDNNKQSPLVCRRQALAPRSTVSCSSAEALVATPTSASVFARAHGHVRDRSSGRQGRAASPKYRPVKPPPAAPPAPPAPPVGPVPPAGPGSGGFPPDVTSAPDPARYDDAPSWNGGANCTSGFTTGARRMQDWIRANWGTATIQGYNCRANTASTSKTSIHGVGRASDWFRNAANPAEAGHVARFIERMTANGAAMARATGVQYWIWNKKQYSVKQSSIEIRTYTGPHPHTDHVHIEQNLAGANLQTSYWRLAG